MFLLPNAIHCRTTCDRSFFQRPQFSWKVTVFCSDSAFHRILRVTCVCVLIGVFFFLPVPVRFSFCQEFSVLALPERHHLSYFRNAASSVRVLVFDVTTSRAMSETTLMRMRLCPANIKMCLTNKILHS